MNYKNGKIYKLVNNCDDEIYVGSTCTTLCKRRYGHKHLSIQKPNRYVYIYLNNIGWENVEIILIENYPCNSKDELLKRERYYIDKLKPSLNKRLPCSYSSNKEYKCAKSKEYRDTHPEHCSEVKRLYYEKNKEHIRAYQQQRRDAQKLRKLYDL